MHSLFLVFFKLIITHRQTVTSFKKKDTCMCAYVLGGMGQALIFSFLPKLYQILLKLQKNKIKKTTKSTSMSSISL